MPITLRTIVLPALITAFASDAAVAQCTNPWSAENSLGGLAGEVHAVHLWDRDGTGPQPPLWVFGGDFLIAGSTSASRIAAFDPASQTWSTLGAGVNARVRALATLPNGDLAVGGEFTTAGGIPTNHVAVWNGASWATMAGGFNTPVWALAVLPNGALVAGGAGPSTIAQWNGSVWAPVGSGLTGTVLTLAVHPTGELFAAGSGLQIHGGPGQHVARWDGSTWTPVGTATAAPPIFSSNFDLLVRSNGDLVLVGDQLSGLIGSGGGRIAVWNGFSWSAMAAPGITTFEVAELSNGDLVAIGSGGPQVVRSTGATWEPLGAGLAQGVVRTVLALPGNELLVGGTMSSGPDIRNAAHWNGTTWVAVGGAWSGSEPRVSARPDGSLVGVITQNTTSYVGLRSAGSWTLLGTANHVLAITSMPNGDVIVGGRFTSIGGAPAARIARWDGVSWSALGSGIGSGPTDSVAALAVMPNGDLIAGGTFSIAGGSAANCVARWDGATWSPLGAGLGPIHSLAVTPEGTIVAGGNFTLNASLTNIARWSGTVWQAIGSGLNQPVLDVAVLPDGSIAACGLFSLPGPFGSQLTPQAAIWTGSTWSAIGNLSVNGPVQTLLAAANGDLLVGGSFTTVNGTPTAGLARWNDAQWSGFAAGAVGVADLTLAPNGDIGVAGSFVQAGGVPSPQFARLSTSCPATVGTIGVGCTGTASSPSLAATSLPWLGTTFRSRATGLPNNSLAVEVLGHSSLSVPLVAILPQGVAGCSLTTTPELLQLHLTNAGTVDLALPLNNSIAFVGGLLYQQVVALSLSPTADILELTSSNSLELVKGWF